MMRIDLLLTAALLESSYATAMAINQVKVLPLISNYQTDCGPWQSGEKDIEYRNNNEAERKDLFRKIAFRRPLDPIPIVDFKKFQIL